MRFGSDPDEIYIAESTKTTGANLFKWSTIRENMGPNAFYKSCTYRHFEYDRKNDNLN